jgi:ribosomal protein S4
MNTLKRCNISFFAVLLVLFGALIASAQIRAPRPSQKASVMQTIGVTDVTITYSRPGVKGRTIWGDPLPEQAATKGEATLDDQNVRPKGAPIVPWGHAWRTGANEATQFVVTDDVLINGQKLPAGSYSLHTIPTKDEFTIIFNSVANQWGSFSYDPAKDTLRVKVKPEWGEHSKEWLEYWIDPVNDNSAQVNIRWEKVRVPFIVEVKDVQGLTMQKARAAVAAAKADDFVTPLQAANYALQNKLSVEEAMGWLDHSIKVKETIGNLGLKARVLAEQGKTAEAITAGERAIQVGKDAKANPQQIANMEKLVAEWKAKKT